MRTLLSLLLLLRQGRAKRSSLLSWCELSVLVTTLPGHYKNMCGITEQYFLNAIHMHVFGCS